MIALFKLLQRRFRGRRMLLFLQLFQLDESTRLLDVGGTPEIWSRVPGPAQIVLINIPGTAPADLSGRFLYVQGNGCSLPFPDRSFDDGKEERT